MLKAPDAEFLNIKALVLRRSISITASDTLASGLSTLVSAMIAGCAGMLTWRLIEWLRFRHLTRLGSASGALAGLVAITPSCAFVSVDCVHSAPSYDFIVDPLTITFCVIFVSVPAFIVSRTPVAVIAKLGHTLIVAVSDWCW